MEVKEFRHPSYGMVNIGRYSTTSERLFGSSVKTNSGISLTISRAYRKHDLHQDWYHSEEELIEVHMTESQFADMITSLNNGSGANCTITGFNGKRIDSPKEERSEAELVHDDVKKHVKEFNDKLNTKIKELNAVLDSSRITQKDRRAIDMAVEFLLAAVANNLPFLMDQFQEALDRTISQAKTEVVAFTERTLKARGLEGFKKDAPQIGLERKE